MGSHTQEQFSCLVISKKPSWRRTNAGRNNLPSDWRNDVKFPPSRAQWDELELPWAQHLNLPCPGGLMLIYPVNIGDPYSSQDCIHQEMQNAFYREHRTPCVTRGRTLFFECLWVAESVPRRIWGAEQVSCSHIQGLCVHPTERTEGFSPAVQGWAFPSSPSFCREARAARSRWDRNINSVLLHQVWLTSCMNKSAALASARAKFLWQQQPILSLGISLAREGKETKKKEKKNPTLKSGKIC